LLEVRVQLPEQPPASGRKIRVDRPDGAGGTSGTSGNSGTAGSSGTQAPPTFGSGS
ncbi:MAG: hypothetical protein JWO93_240, partial [Micrococcaceae bacterium]|nr:hypothetical protein [Micrococcaceae bacterium]